MACVRMKHVKHTHGDRRPGRVITIAAHHVIDCFHFFVLITLLVLHYITLRQGQRQRQRQGR